jgi:hypothetical protein
LITRIDEADARGSHAHDRETIEIEYPSAARGVDVRLATSC